MSIQLIITSEFDINSGAVLKDQYPLTEPLIKDQLPFLSELVIPDQLHNKSLDKEDFTLFPIYYNDNGFSYTQSGNDTQLMLFTVCNYKYDTKIDRNYSIKSLSIITDLPFFISLKPIMVMLLENYFQSNDFNLLKEFLIEFNKYPLGQLQIKLTKFQRLNYLQYLKDHDLDKLSLLGGNIQFNEVKDNIEINIPIRILNQMLKIPFRISILSLIASPILFFGYNLDQELILLKFISSLNEFDVLNHSDEICPFEDTNVLIMIICAILTGKRIIVLSYNKSINDIMEFVLLMLILVPNWDSNTILRDHTYPYFDISKLDLVENLKHYIIGTSNPIFKELIKNGDKLWDVLIELDTKQITINKKDTDIKVKPSIFNKKISFKKLKKPDEKFEFEKCLINDNIPIDSMANEIEQLNQLISNKQDDLLIFQFIIKNFEILGYNKTFTNIQLSYNLNKLINYRTKIYELLDKDDSPQLYEKFSSKIIELNNELILPYKFNIFQLNNNDKKILEYHNNEVIKKIGCIKIYNNLYQYDKTLPITIENDLNYFINIHYYIDKLFNVLRDLNQLNSIELRDIIISYQSIITNDNLIEIFYYLTTIKRFITIGNIDKELNLIEILIILKKFINIDDNVRNGIDNILNKFNISIYSQLINDYTNEYIE